MRAQLCVRSVLRLLRRLAYADFHRQQFTLTSISCAAQRSGPEIIKPDCDTHMRISAADAVCCIESHPAQVGNTRLGPRMTRLLLGEVNDLSAPLRASDPGLRELIGNIGTLVDMRVPPDIIGAYTEVARRYLMNATGVREDILPA